MKIYLVDDDIAIINMLENIIIDYDLGNVIGKAHQGDIAIDQILSLNPDIVVVDLLLPKVDGIELIKRVKERRERIQFIMLSQVTSREMICDAYKSGIEFFINKPINVIEVKTVIKKASERIQLKKIINRINESSQYNRNEIHTNPLNKKTDMKTADRIFSELGISNESGIKDLRLITHMIIQERIELGKRYHRYNIGDMYLKLNAIYIKEGYRGSKNIRAIEQRIRRTIQQALDNISMLGIEDFGSYKFDKYSSRVFEFSEMKKNMDYIRGKSNYRGKVNVKAFIEGVINIMDD